MPPRCSELVCRLGVRPERFVPVQQAAGPRTSYRRCVVGLYAQALLTLGDSALADDVVGGVIVDECAPPSVPGLDEDEARYRLAERPSGAIGRWPLARRGRTVTPRSGPPRAWPTAWILVAFWARNSEKRSVLALSGGLGYVRAGRVLGLYPGVISRACCTPYCAGWRSHRPPLSRAAAQRPPARWLLPGRGTRMSGPRRGPAEEGEMMRTLGYAAAITVAAAGAALGLVVAVRGLQDARRYLKMKRM